MKHISWTQTPVDLFFLLYHAYQQPSWESPSAPVSKNLGTSAAVLAVHEQRRLESRLGSDWWHHGGCNPLLVRGAYTVTVLPIPLLKHNYAQEYISTHSSLSPTVLVVRQLNIPYRIPIQLHCGTTTANTHLSTAASSPHQPCATRLLNDIRCADVCTTDIQSIPANVMGKEDILRQRRQCLLAMPVQIIPRAPRRMTLLTHDPQAETVNGGTRATRVATLLGSTYALRHTVRVDKPLGHNTPYKPPATTTTILRLSGNTSSGCRCLSSLYIAIWDNAMASTLSTGHAPHRTWAFSITVI